MKINIHLTYRKINKLVNLIILWAMSNLKPKISYLLLRFNLYVIYKRLKLLDYATKLILNRLID